MTEYLLGEFVDNLNEIVKQPINLTQRIKYTCCDVSKEYIVFGASSGGLYVFHRHPCSFDRLIPSTEGSILQISISQDEKLFAFSSSKGTICLVDLASKNIEFQVYNEHVGNLITAMKWNEQNNELFAGDNMGKISVVTYTNFITKTMFQNPCSPILQLDSKVVQIDICSNFLLVSTLTRCYICDTVKEQYRQIGQKLRDGEFGACFYGSTVSNLKSVRQESQSGVFKILGDKESFSTTVDLQNFKIFCARPGLRLWEVNINGSVLRTHQFKQALNEPQDIIAIKDTDSHLELIQNIPSQNSSQYNFIKMFTFHNGFILTFKNDALYVLDPLNGRIILWTNKYSNVIDIKIVKNQIYLVTQKLKIHNLLFTTLETFVLRSFFNKQYIFCANVCIKYEKELKDLVPNSSKLHVLKGLHEKLENEVALLSDITSLLNTLSSEPKVLVKKLENGIYLIDNAHYINDTITETNFEAGPSSENMNNDEQNDFSTELQKIYEQYELDAIIGNHNTKVLTDILNEYSLDNVFNIMMKLEEYALNLNVKKTDIQKWCNEQMLSYFYYNKDYVLIIFNLSLDENLGLYIKDAFLNINQSSELSCSCNFPLPVASLMVPKFIKLGYCLLEKIYKHEQTRREFCNKVPYMWGQVLKLQQNDNLTNLLPLLIQYNDKITFELFLKKFTYDHWHEALKLFIQLHAGRCLKCERPISIDGLISWNDFANKMLKSIGAESTVELFLQYADKIPTSALNPKFYQTLIFSSMATNFQPQLRIQSVDFMNNICENEQRNDFEKLLEKTLQNPSSSLAHNQVKTEGNCSSCNLPIQSPVLSRETPISLQCGHMFHNLCYKYQKNICNICMLN